MKENVQIIIKLENDDKIHNFSMELDKTIQEIREELR
jgi:hypothetical protein